MAILYPDKNVKSCFENLKNEYDWCLEEIEIIKSMMNDIDSSNELLLKRKQQPLELDTQRNAMYTVYKNFITYI